MLRMESLLVLSLNHQLHLESLIFLYPARQPHLRDIIPVSQRLLSQILATGVGLHLRHILEIQLAL